MAQEKPKPDQSSRRFITRSECERCGAEVRPGKRWHFCGEPYPLRKAATVTRTYELVQVASDETGRS